MFQALCVKITAMHLLTKLHTLVILKTLTWMEKPEKLKTPIVETIYAYKESHTFDITFILEIFSLH